MHEPRWDPSIGLVPYRICCWCPFTQNREYTGEPRHGPNFKVESRDWHWEPLHVGRGGCPGKPEDLQRGQVTYAQTDD